MCDLEGVLGELRAGRVGAGARATDGLEDVSGGEVAQITLCLLGAEGLGVPVPGATHPACHSDIVQSGDGAFVEVSAMGEFGESAPYSPRTHEATVDRLCLLVVGGQVETDPAGDVLLGTVVGSAVVELAVVLPRVARPPQPALDGGELGGEDTLPGDHQGLQGSGQTAVAVGPGVDGDQLQVHHCGPDQGVAAVLSQSTSSCMRSGTSVQSGAV